AAVVRSVRRRLHLHQGRHHLHPETDAHRDRVRPRRAAHRSLVLTTTPTKGTHHGREEVPWMRKAVQRERRSRPAPRNEGRRVCQLLPRLEAPELTHHTY